MDSEGPKRQSERDTTYLRIEMIKSACTALCSDCRDALNPDRGRLLVSDFAILHAALQPIPSKGTPNQQLSSIIISYSTQ